MSEYIDKEINEAISVLSPEMEDVLLVLKSHLYIENLLERIILAKLKRGDILIEEGNLSFYQKLVLINSFKITSDNVIEATKKLNKLRNDCVHNLEKKITKNDIEKIGRLFGKEYNQIKKNNFGDKYTMVQVIARIFINIQYVALKLENPNFQKELDNLKTEKTKK